jgi:gamma-glutamyltranspeptidase/glutathione hydrolase
MNKHLFAYFIGCLLNFPLLANASNAALAMPDSYSAQAVKQVLESNGNAIDAAIAAQFVLAVTFPEAGNIGGGGFMTIYKDGEANFLDYREVAPEKAHRDMYLDNKGDVIPYISLYGALSSGVPGTVDGMWKAHQKYGTKSWQSLLAPAIKLAEQGFIIHPALAEGIEWRAKSFTNKNIKVNFAKHFSHAKAGSLFKQPALASSLKRIALQGRDGFYKGKTAELFSKFMKKNGGIINKNDLANYQAIWRKPIVHNWRDQTIITAPPPSSGGIAIIQWLTMVNNG